MSLTSSCQLSGECNLAIGKYNLKSADQCCSLSCAVSNARSLKNKLSELYHMLYSWRPDIIFVTETWLHRGFPDSLLDPQGSYNILRYDRAGGHNCVSVFSFPSILNLCLSPPKKH